MIETLIKILLGMPNVYMPILAAALAFNSAKRNNQSYSSCLLPYLLFLSVGLVGLWAFVGHVFFPQFSAQAIGWETSPFQFEVGMTNLSYGLLGCLSFFKRSWGLWLGTTIGSSVFLFGAGLGHIYQIIEHHNFSFDNAGPILFTDIIMPVIMVSLLYVNRKNKVE